MFSFAEYISSIADIKSMIIVFGLCIFCLWYANKKFLTSVWIGSVLVTVGTTYIVKVLLHIPRPLNALIVEDGFRFPSGHASVAAIFGILIVYTIFTLYTSRTVRAASVIFACVWFACVAWSRLFLGVHYPIDIMGGLAAALVSFYTCKRVVNIFF